MDLLGLGIYRTLSGTRGPSPDEDPSLCEDVPEIAMEACREIAVALNLFIRSLTGDAPR